MLLERDVDSPAGERYCGDSVAAGQGDVSLAFLAGAAGGVGELAMLMGKPGEGPTLPVPFARSICLCEDMLVAGTSHIGGIDDIVACLEEGARLRFRRAMDNLHDTWAVEVYDLQDRRMGFLPASSNEMIARMMDAGKCVYGTFAYASKRGAWNRIHMEVYLDD